MQTYNMYEKKAGQSFKLIGKIRSSSFKEAQKEWAKICYNDLLNGIYGDNYIELSKITDNVKEDGVYYNGELFMPNSDLHEGIETFREDVYTWEIRDCITVKIYDEGEFYSEDYFEKENDIVEMYPKEDGYTYKIIN